MTTTAGLTDNRFPNRGAVQIVNSLDCCDWVSCQINHLRDVSPPSFLRLGPQLLRLPRFFRIILNCRAAALLTNYGRSNPLGRMKIQSRLEVVRLLRVATMLVSRTNHVVPVAVIKRIHKSRGRTESGHSKRGSHRIERQPRSIAFWQVTFKERCTNVWNK